MEKNYGHNHIHDCYNSNTNFLNYYDLFYMLELLSTCHIILS